MISPAQDEMWRAQAECVAGICADAIPSLVGVYVHGSAALGGFTRTSDLDVLVVASGRADWSTLGERLLSDGSHPHPLELSVVEAPTCRYPARPWPYLLHVNSGQARFALDEGSGDPDLLAHYAIARSAGIPIVGPATAKIFGGVSRSELLAYLRDELRWGSEHADQRYAVLNACRAQAYADEGLLLSKVEGARWWLGRIGPEQLVYTALHAQEEGRSLGPCPPAAQAFIARTISNL